MMEEINWGSLGDDEEVVTCSACESTNGITTYKRKPYCPVHLAEVKERERKKREEKKETVEVPTSIFPPVPASDERIPILEGKVGVLEQVFEVMRDVFDHPVPPTSDAGAGTDRGIQLPSDVDITNDALAWAEKLDPEENKAIRPIITRLRGNPRVPKSKRDSIIREAFYGLLKYLRDHGYLRVTIPTKKEGEL